MQRILILVTISCFSRLGYCYADDFISCHDDVQQSGQLQIQGILKSNNQGCMIIIHPTETPDLKFRSYIFDSSESFLVFNSFGDGPENTQTGARLFFLFPRVFNLSYRILPDKNIQVQTPSGEVFTFNSKTTFIENISNSKFSEDPKIHNQNKGGVEILKFPHLILDLGFMIGNDPRSNPNRNSIFYLNKKSCSVKNSEIIDYSTANEPSFRYKSDESLTAFTKKRCPQLFF